MNGPFPLVSPSLTAELNGSVPLGCFLSVPPEAGGPETCGAVGLKISGFCFCLVFCFCFLFFMAKCRKNMEEKLSCSAAFIATCVQTDNLGLFMHLRLLLICFSLGFMPLVSHERPVLLCSLLV